MTDQNNPPVSFSLIQIGMVLAHYNPLSQHDFQEIMTIFEEMVDQISNARES